MIYTSIGEPLSCFMQQQWTNLTWPWTMAFLRPLGTGILRSTEETSNALSIDAKDMIRPDAVPAVCWRLGEVTGPSEIPGEVTKACCWWKFEVGFWFVWFGFWMFSVGWLVGWLCTSQDRMTPGAGSTLLDDRSTWVWVNANHGGAGEAVDGY